MLTQRIGTLDVDRARIADELERNSGVPYASSYTEFVIGGPWKTRMLWSMGGETGDGVLSHYDHSRACAPTLVLEHFPYIATIIERWFNLKYLRFARLASLTDNLLIPHRDYVEFADIPPQARSAHRLHVPLLTNDRCYFTERNVVFRMRCAEVWFLDASREHGSASFSNEARTHLILDFANAEDTSWLTKFPANETAGIPADSICERHVLTDAERGDLLRLAKVIDMDNLRDVLSIVIKKHYRRDGGENFVWKTLLALAAGADDPAVQDRMRELYGHYLLERAE